MHIIPDVTPPLGNGMATRTFFLTVLLLSTTPTLAGEAYARSEFYKCPDHDRDCCDVDPTIIAFIDDYRRYCMPSFLEETRPYDL